MVSKLLLSEIYDFLAKASLPAGRESQRNDLKRSRATAKII